MISRQLRPKSCSVTRAFLPLKLLAVQSGLGRYGRNNVCYVPGMGSFFQLAAYYSNMQARTDFWQEPKAMPICENCHACHLNCPTRAISNDRFLLNAEKCLVFHNEKRGNIPFADWIDPSWHNCLIGCALPKHLPLEQRLQELDRGGRGILRRGDQNDSESRAPRSINPCDYNKTSEPFSVG